MALKPAIHGRDHCPGGADPIPCLGAFEYARFQRISDSNVTVLNANNTVVSGTSGQDVNTDTSKFQINANNEIQMLVGGLVSVWAQTVWGTYDTTFRQVGVWNFAPSPDVIVVMGGSGNDLYDPVVIGGVVRVAIGAKLKLVVNQNSGGGQSLYGGGSDADEINFLEVHYLGAVGT